MPEIVLAQVVLPHLSGLPKDNVVNTFTFTDDGGASSVDPVDLEVAITNFYGHVAAGATDPSLNSIGKLLSPEISRATPVDIKLYSLTGHLDGSPHGSPFATRHFTLGAAGSATRLPGEVALCMSFRGDYGTADEDVPAGPAGPPGNVHERARLRGRIYVGPLCATGMGATGADQRLRPSFNAMNTLLEAGKSLRDDPDTKWVVWSRTNASVVAVSTIWCDDEFDTQRRRGGKPLSRVTG